MIKEKTERGVMLMKDLKAWGVVYEDGRSHEEGWVEPVNAEIYDPKYCKKPSDLTYKNSPYIAELNSGTFAYVERKTTVKICGEVAQ